MSLNPLIMFSNPPRLAGRTRIGALLHAAAALDNAHMLASRLSCASGGRGFKRLGQVSLQ